MMDQEDETPTVAVPQSMISEDQASKMQAGDLVKLFRGLRDKKKVMDDEYEQRVANIVATMVMITMNLEQRMLADNVKSINTPFGTAIMSTKDTAMCGDWLALYEYIAKNKRFDLLHKRVSSEAVASIIEDTGTPPPGVTMSMQRQVTIRKPSK
jgi:hypothetical protein